MPRKRHKPEEIVAKLRQVDVLVRSAAGNWGWDAPCLSDQESGFRFGAGAQQGASR